MSLNLHRMAEKAIEFMDAAKSSGDYDRAAYWARCAAGFERDAISELRQYKPERVKTIRVLEESSRALTASAKRFTRIASREHLAGLSVTVEAEQHG